ncbi:MAG: flagellar biosynthetic protein FliR [Oscillospiraceae bacterium]
MILDYNFTLFSFVFMRMFGCIMFNPIFGRKSIPTVVKVALTFLLAIFTYSVIPQKDIEITGLFVYAFLLMKELLVGFIVGFIMQLFLSVITLGGEYMDFNMGISMSKVYDPQSNISMAVSASIINAMFIMVFFATNAHLTMIKIFVTLGQISPYGDLALPAEMFTEIVSLFSLVLIYSVKLALPIMAIEFITEMGVGLLMKAVPQINIFAVNIQLKVFLGFVCIALLVGPYAKFVEKLIEVMLQKIVLIFGI